MTFSRQMVLIVDNWDRIEYPSGLIPSETTVIELLYPHVDPTVLNIQWCDENQIENIQDRISQLILRKWSDHIIFNRMTELRIARDNNFDPCIPRFIIQTSEILGVDWMVYMYHHSVTEYFNSIFPIIGSSEVKEAHKMYNARLNKDGLFIPITRENRKPNAKLLTKSRHQNKQLADRFSDYKKSSEVMAKFFQEAHDKNPIRFGELYRGMRDGTKKHTRNRRSTTRRFQSPRPRPYQPQC